jgi:hypothetical protein
MVAIDTRTGASIPVGGAALLSGPALVIGSARRQDESVRRPGAVRVPDGANRRPLSEPVRQDRLTGASAATADAPDVSSLDQIESQLPGLQRQPVMPARWGVPAYFAGAPFGPPYELTPRMAEWELSASTAHAFRASDRAGRMARASQPRTALSLSSGQFLSQIYGQTPTPQYAGLSFDAYL